MVLATQDASELGYGGKLEQNFKTRDQDPDEIHLSSTFQRIIQRHRKTMSKTEKEMLAVVIAV